jgi:hypothetical protein
MFDVGEESDTTINKALQKARVHFVADAQASTGADVKLAIELSETNNKDEAQHMAAIPGYLPAGTQASAATKDMQQFAASTPKGTINLNFTLESSAYGKLTCSPYNGDKPPVNQDVDANNWKVFHDASMALLSLSFGGGVTYPVWAKWNRAANGILNESAPADRRHCGDWDGSDARAIWTDDPNHAINLDYFCLATSSFMDLCDDLQRLAELVSKAKIPDDWNLLLGDLKDIVMRDVKTDFAKPAVAALLKLCPAKTVSYDKQVCGNALTCTISLV